MGIDFKMIKIHQIVSDSGDICKRSSGRFSKIMLPNGHYTSIENQNKKLIGIVFFFSVVYADRPKRLCCLQ